MVGKSLFTRTGITSTCGIRGIEEMRFRNTISSVIC